MAFTLHWANSALEYNSNPYPGTLAALFDSRIIPDEYREKIGALTPALSLQHDVLFPNALQGVTSLLHDGVSGAPVGCKGNQLDNDFPLEARVPVPLPMVQYAVNTRTGSREDEDICALPVLNWEAYVKNLRSTSTTLLKSYYERKTGPNGSRVREQKKEILGKTMHPSEDEIQNDPCLPSFRSKQLAGSINYQSRPLNSLLLDSGSHVEEAEAEKNPAPKRRRGRPRKGETEAYLKNWPSTSSTLLKSNCEKKTGASRHVKSLLLDTGSDVEEAEAENKPTKKRRQGRRCKEKIKIQFNKPQVRTKQMTKRVAEKFDNLPALKVQATWNYLYGGTGTSDWSYAQRNERNLYVANGTHLRMISLKPSRENAMLSYSVASVWEESELPVFPQRKVERMEVLNDVIFQVQTQKRRNLVAVRRGRSVGIYSDERLPSLLCTVPNVGYGATDYLGWKSKKTLKSSPLLLCMDFNHICSSELVTIDQNAIIQFVDLAGQQVSHQVEAHRLQESRGPSSELSQSELNAAFGVAYVADNPHVIYQWVDSQVSLYDRRDRPRTALTTELLNLRSSLSSLSWSDQHHFRTDSAKKLNEYISCLKPGSNALCYYVGTTSRVLLMDVRVPANPVVKFEHGMRSPVAYLDILNDENFEVLVGGSQRTSEVFCATFDNTHLACVNRPECQQRNPVLQSYPRHLQSTGQFLDYASERGYGFNYESDQRKVEKHFAAWCTGLCVMNPVRTRSYKATLPHPFLLYTANTFGDVFCQEWDQKPMPTSRRVGEHDPRLNTFMGGWKTSMESSVLDEFRRPSRNPHEPVDCSLIVESSSHSLRHCRRIRTHPFNSFRPSQLTYNRVCDTLPSVQEQAAKLAQYDSDRVRSFLGVWSEQFCNVGSPDPQHAAQQNNYSEDQATAEAGLKSDVAYQTEQMLPSTRIGGTTTDNPNEVIVKAELSHDPCYSDMDLSEDELQQSGFQAERGTSHDD